MSQSKNKQNRNEADTKIDEELEKELAKKKRGRIYWSLFLLAVVILFIVNNSGGESEQGPYPPNYLENRFGKIKLSDYAGKIVILNFWTTWDQPSIKSIPDLIEIKNKYKNKNIEIIGIALDGVTKDGKTKKDVVPFIENNGINFPVVYGSKKLMYDYGGLKTIPASFVLDSDGNIISTYQGLVLKETYIKEIESILANEQKGESLARAPEFQLPLVKKIEEMQ